MAAAKGRVTKKSSDSLLERGYKSWCENTALSIRKRLGKDAVDALRPLELAEALGVRVWDLDDVDDLPVATKAYLSSSSGDEWSAVTVIIEGQEIVLTNPTHSPARQSTDLMHELAHVIKKHEAGTMYISDSGLALRDFDQKQEQEADWLAGTLLLPRVVLTHCAYERKPVAQILDEYVVSKQLYDYRMRKTAVNRQFRRQA